MYCGFEPIIGVGTRSVPITLSHEKRKYYVLKTKRKATSPLSWLSATNNTVKTSIKERIRHITQV